ncbi:hypothetical protein ACHAW6_000492 [Cyclotella cf. meneghiniana]
MVDIEGQLFTDRTGQFLVTSNRGNNYIIIFYTVDANHIKSYPIKKTDITLNMMLPCTQNPNLFAYEAFEGMFSFDATPMAPIGTECMIHTESANHHTWGYHAIKAWYVAPALNHYHCIKVVTDTGAIRITDTYTFIHHTLPTPTISNADHITKAIKHLEHTINEHLPTKTNELEAITCLHNLLIRHNPTPDLPVIHTHNTSMTIYHAPVQHKPKHTNHAHPPPLNQQIPPEHVPTSFT